MDTKDSFLGLRERVLQLFGGGVWEVGREMIVDWAWREQVEIASCRPMRGRIFRFLLRFSWTGWSAEWLVDLGCVRQTGVLMVCGCVC